MKSFHRPVMAALKPRCSLRLLSPLVGAVLLAVLLVTGVSATATPPSTFYACVNFNGGSIYMIQQDQTCKPPYTKISWNQIGPVGPQGPQGPQGPAGPQGPQGPAGPTQTLSVQDTATQTVIPAKSGIGHALATCPAGTVVSGGGFDILAGGTTDWSVVENLESSNGWLVTIDNESSNDISLIVHAECLTLG